MMELHESRFDAGPRAVESSEPVPIAIKLLAVAAVIGFLVWSFVFTKPVERSPADGRVPVEQQQPQPVPS